jgi:hypothetical protein
MVETSHLTEVAEQLADAASADVFQPVRARVAELAAGDDALRAIVARATHAPEGQQEFLRLRARVRQEVGDEAAIFERYALLRAAEGSVQKIASLPVPASVKRQLLEEFVWLTQPKEQELKWFAAPSYNFGALCRLVTLRRFPAGQMHFEVNGLQRSVLFRVRWPDWPRVTRGVRALGGFRPALVPHLAFRKRQIVLSEREHYRSLFQMAQALELQPRLLGFVAEAWFYSPDTPIVSPHLAWAQRLFETWGGFVVRSGNADETSGVFEQSRARRESAEKGKFRPTLGLVIWPRAAMQRWAAQYRAENGIFS